MNHPFVILAMLCTLPMLSQHDSDAEIRDLLMEKDSLFWVGYNTCNLDLMADFLAKDMEFYHDMGGIIHGEEGMRRSMQDNICNDPNNHVRRELVPETFELHLLRNGDTVYGAIINGEHYFYNSYNGAKEHKNGKAKFSNLWLLEDGVWTMHRIFSFDHQATD